MRERSVTRWRGGLRVPISLGVLVLLVAAAVARGVVRQVNCVAPQMDPPNCSFLDTSGLVNPWASAVISVCNSGLMPGCSDPNVSPGYFCPGEPVPRDDMAVFLGRGLHGSA